MLINLKNGKISVHQEGKKIEEFENFHKFAANSGISSQPFTPGFMLVLKGLEESTFPADGQLRGFVQEHQMPFCK